MVVKGRIPFHTITYLRFNSKKAVMKYTLLTLFLLVSCSRAKEQLPETASTAIPETYSFSGKPLYPKTTDSAALAKSESIITAIRSKEDLSEDDFIDIGRQLVGTNRFNLTINNYGQGLEKFPQSFKLLRHRGHRYINLRQLDNAIADLTRAEELIRPQPEVWELDAAGKPTSTYQHQIWYHIGLYHFLMKNYTEAAAAFEKSLASATGGRNIAGASDWLYNAYQRSDEKGKIENLLKPFTPEFDIDDKDYPYYRRLLLFNGIITPEELIDVKKPIDQMSLTEMTKLYGLAIWYRYRGESAKANELCMKILESKEWAGFAYAAAELDVAEDEN